MTSSIDEREKKKVDGKTIAIWGDAICSAMLGDRRELVELLRYDNEVTPDLKEFLAWLLDERKNGRPPLPTKFKILNQMARDPKLFDAVVDFELERAHWRASRRRFPYKMKLEEIALRNSVDSSKLDNKLRRSAKSGSKLGG
jgi:hypothetical protein